MSEPIVFPKVPISIFQTHDMNNKPARRLFIAVTDLSVVPDELFAIKVSQSKKPELAGKPVFKYFSYKVSENIPFSPLAPATATLQTPTSELKAAVLEKIGKIPGAVFSLAINMNGHFGNITTPEGVFTLFDDQRFPQSEGKPGYYLKSNTEAKVTLTKATSQYGPYYRVQLETEEVPDDIFVKSGRSKVWGEEDSGVTGAPTDSNIHAAIETNDGSVW